MVAAPVLYSWLYYKKQLSQGDELKAIPTTHNKAGKAGSSIGILILALCAVLMVTGNVEVTFGDTAPRRGGFGCVLLY